MIAPAANVPADHPPAIGRVAAPADPVEQVAALARAPPRRAAGGRVQEPAAVQDGPQGAQTDAVAAAAADHVPRAGAAEVGQVRAQVGHAETATLAALAAEVAIGPPMGVPNHATRPSAVLPMFVPAVGPAAHPSRQRVSRPRSRVARPSSGSTRDRPTSRTS